MKTLPEIFDEYNQNYIHDQLYRERHLSKEHYEKWRKYSDHSSAPDPSPSDSLRDEIRGLRDFTVIIPVGGMMVEVKRNLGAIPGRISKRKGDIIVDYTRGSRNRFQKALLSIDYEKNGVPLFFTLTYPGEYPRDPKIWKKDLDKWSKRLSYRFGSQCVVCWKLEEQKRGAPHYCGFIWGCDWLLSSEGKKWLSLQWYEVVGSGDERHLLAGTGIERIESLDRMINYLVKYAVKDEQKFDYPVGRYWGIINRKGLCIEKQEIKVDENIAFRMKRVMKRSIKQLGKKKQKHQKVLGHRGFGMWARWDNETAFKVIDNIVSSEERGCNYD